jgi:hypothetical protein
MTGQSIGKGTLLTDILVEALPGDDADQVELRQEAGRIARLLLDGTQPFEIRVGEFQIDAQRATVQSAVAAAVLAIAAREAGLDSVPVALLALTLPFLVDIQRIELRPSERVVLAALRDDILEPGSPRVWYERLPETLREQLTELEFTDLLARLQEYGAVREVSGEVQLLPPRRHLRFPFPWRLRRRRAVQGNTGPADNRE